MVRNNKEEYVCCRNPRCKPFEHPRHKSWRYVSHGPDACKFCDTPFRVPLRAAGDGWSKYNSKGRVVPADAGSANAGGGGTGGVDHKGGKKQKVDPAPSPPKGEADDDAFAKLCREKFKDDPAKLSLVEAAFPAKPKSEADCLKEALAMVEKAQAAQNHIQGICEKMQTAYLKKAEDLLEYRGRVQQHEQKLDEAKSNFQAAKDELALLQAKQAHVGATAQFTTSADPFQLLASYNPVQGIVDSMSAVEGFDKVPLPVATAIQSNIEEMVKNHLNQFASALRVGTLPMPFLVSNAAAASAVLSGCGFAGGADGTTDLGDPTLSIDVSMQHTGVKRGAEHIQESQEGFTDEFSLENFDGGQDTAQAAGHRDTEQMLRDAVDAATAAVVQRDATSAAASASGGSRV